MKPPPFNFKKGDAMPKYPEPASRYRIVEKESGEIYIYTDAFNVRIATFETGVSLDEAERMVAAMNAPLSELGTSDAERWRFCMEHGFPKGSFNPEHQVDYFYVRLDCYVDEQLTWSTPQRAVDGTMAWWAKRQSERKET